MKDLTYALIGSGFMGGVLAEVASDLPYVSCVGVMDIDQGRADAMAKKVGGQAYLDFEKMLEKERPDAVIIATPEPYHLEPVRAAAQAGCQVFVEKPIATTLADADEMIRVCAEAGVILMTGYVLRFEVSYAMIQEAVQDGSIGKFMSAYARRVATIDEARRLNGRVSPVEYIAVHDIDQFLWYHPVPVKSVYARALKGRVWDELGTYDCAWITLEFEDGALAVEEVGWTLPEEWANAAQPQGWGGFGDVRMNVKGRDGAIELNYTPMDLYSCTRSGWKFPDTRHWPKMDGKLVGAAKFEVEHFFESILKGEKPRVSGEDGRRSLEVMLAAEKSIAENRIITLPL